MSDLPREIYLYIFILADSLEATKVLRSVNKTAWHASYDYFKILLNKPVFITYDHEWFIHNDNTEMKCKGCAEGVCHAIMNSCINGNSTFKMSIRDLFSIQTNHKLID